LKRGSLATTSACKMRRRARSRCSRRICKCQQSLLIRFSTSTSEWLWARTQKRMNEKRKEGRKKGSIPLASILQWVWAN
jgi:hypothetical protein